MLVNVLSVTIGILGTIALSGTMSFLETSTAYTNSTTAFILGILAVCGLRYVYGRIDISDMRGKVWSGIYAFSLAFALTAGKQLHTVENFSVGDWYLWLQILILGLFFWGFVLYLFQNLAGKTDIEKKCARSTEGMETIRETEKKDGWKSFFVDWSIIFLCWIPVFLAFYPGAFVYDAQDEYVQVATRTFSTHHPLSHVLLLGGFVCLGNKLWGSYNIGIALYTIFQMLVLSGVFAYTISYLRAKLSKKTCIVLVLFYGLFPIFPMYAVCSAKDTLFTGAFLLMLVQILKLRDGIGKGKITVLLVSATAMMLLRNNGVYVVLALTGILLAVMTLICKKNKYILGMIMCLFCSFLIYKGIDTALTVILHADDSENQEILTVPIQQLARTYKYSPEVFGETEREILFSFIPEDALKIYDADLSDLVKVNFNNSRYQEEAAVFWDLWYQTFKKKPFTYLNAWLMTSYGYWYPDTIINVYGGNQVFTYQYEDSSYFGFETELPGTRDSKFPWLEEQYRKMSLEIYQQKVPVISMFFSPGFLFWIFMGSLLSCCYMKKYSWLPILGSIFLLWGTVILGPTFLVRYVLVLWFALPLWSVLYCSDCEK